MKILLRNDSDKPIYEQIAEQIKAAIIQETLGEGEALPSMRKLAQDLRISVITTKKAYEILDQEGYIYTVAGKGCYVSPKNMALIKEAKMRQIEDYFYKGLVEARALGLSFDEMVEVLDTLYRDGEEIHE